MVDRSLWEQVTGSPSSWFDWILDIFIPQTIKVSDLCALNPDDPAFPAPENVAAALTNIPQYVSELMEWMRLKLRYIAFTQGCVCDSPPAFSCTTLVTHPKTYSNTTSVSDGEWGIEFIPAADCWLYGGYQRVGAVGTGQYKHCVYGPTITGGFRCENITPTTSDAAYFFVTPFHLTGGQTYKYTGKFPSGTGWQLRYDGVNVTPADTTYAHFNYQVGRTAADPFTVQSPFTFPADPLFCPQAGTPPQVEIPSQPIELPTPTPWACSTIGDLCTRLFQMQQTIDWVRRLVVLGMTHNGPLQYTMGTAHSSLTGSGSIVVSDILGVFVELTTVPSTWGRTASTPPRYIPSPGSIHAGTDDGLQEAVVLHYDEHWIDNLNSLTTEIAYSFRSGITARITEILPTP